MKKVIIFNPRVDTKHGLFFEQHIKETWINYDGIKREYRDRKKWFGFTKYPIKITVEYLKLKEKGGK